MYSYFLVLFSASHFYNSFCSLHFHAFHHQRHQENWDCESILSTRSTAYNHPKLISEPSRKIKINPKTGIPRNVLGTNKGEEEEEELEAEEQSQSEDDDELPKQNAGAPRKKGESKEEKKARKRAVKEARKARRETKKAVKVAFKKEEQRQMQVQHNARSNIQGKRIV
eukprot:m.153574 g.153574  ORF g.153574 m.153574 type:complete len:168 (+) comp24595_c0_seq1:668-1171(+)